MYNENRLNLLGNLGGPLGWDDEVESFNEWLRFWLYRVDFIPALYQAAFNYYKGSKISDYKKQWEEFYSTK